MSHEVVGGLELRPGAEGLDVGVHGQEERTKLKDEGLRLIIG